MLCVSFAMTSDAFEDGSKTESRRFWKPRHAAKFKPGTVFMGITKDFRGGGVRIHPARVVFCRQERLGDMTEESYQREGGARYWENRAAYIAAMGGPEGVPWVLRFEHVEMRDFVLGYFFRGVGYHTVVGSISADAAEKQFRIDNPHVEFRECYELIGHEELDPVGRRHDLERP